MIRPCKDAWAVARRFSLILKSQQFSYYRRFQVFLVLRQL